jgi:hypothetical protein
MDCVPTQNIYAFHMTVTENICYFLTQLESTGVFAGDRDDEYSVAVR